MHHIKFFFTRKESLISGLIFFINAVITGNWFVRIPDVKNNIGLNDAELGVALLGAPIGAMFVLPFAGWIIGKLEVGRTIFISSFFYLLGPVLLAISSSYFTLFCALFYFGFTNAIMDVAMNAAAALTERSLKKNIMASCHAMWSSGAMIGAVMASLTLSFSIPVLDHFLFLSLVSVIAISILRRSILTFREEVKLGEKSFALPNKTLLMLSAIGLCIMLSEGAIGDWSTLYMKEVVKSSNFATGLSYGAYSLAMAFGRFAGDGIIPVLGKRKVVVVGGLLSGGGLIIALLTSMPLVAVSGFAVTGLGYSCVIPVIFSSASNEPGYTHGAGLSSVTTFGYFGFLAGPPFIGLISESYSLTAALSILILLALFVSILGLVVKLR